MSPYAELELGVTARLKKVDKKGFSALMKLEDQENDSATVAFATPGGDKVMLRFNSRSHRVMTVCGWTLCEKLC